MSLLHEPLPRFVVQMALIIAVSRALGALARRIGQPIVVAEVTAGILLGPSLFGLLWPDAYRVVFAPESLKLLSLVSQVGLIFFMFLIGVELDPAMLRGRAHTSVAISHASIVAPFGMGAILAVYLHRHLAEPGVSFAPFALFVGAAMSITAFPVLARILSEQRLLRTKVGAVTITCAAVDDVTAWCILAFVVAATRASGVRGAVITTGLALSYIAVMFAVVRPLIARIAARAPRREVLTQNVVAVIVVVLLASSFVTELIGIHALFGAFLFGAILPKQTGFTRALSEKLEELVLVALLPLFFAFSGVRTQIGLLSGIGDWAICGLIILTACLGKFGASAVVARATGLSWRESSTLGILMNTRGLMELIVLNIGLDLGVIGPRLFTMMVLMALITTFMTTPLLRLSYPLEQRARELAELAAAEGASAAALPSFRLLVCVANERMAPSLGALAAALCRPADSQLYALSLGRPSERGSFADDSDGAQRRSVIAPLVESARRASLRILPLSFTSTDPGSDIAHVAESRSADLILLGSHKPVVGQSLLAGAVNRVMRSTDKAVGVLIDHGLERVRRVLVPFMGTPHDYAALELANRMLANPELEVTVLHVVDPERRSGAARLGAESAFASTFREVGGGQVNFRVLEAKSPADAVLAEAERGYDLVLVGMARDWGLEQRPFGIQGEHLLLDCRTSVLVVRRRLALENVTVADKAWPSQSTSLPTT